MTDKTEPATPGSGAGVARHSLRRRISGARARVRRGHVVAAGIVIVLAAGVVWATLGGGSGNPGATGPNLGATQPAPLGAATSPPGVAATPAPTSPAANSSEGSGYPVPTWTAPNSGQSGFGGTRGRGGAQNQPPGLPSNLSATRDGGAVLLTWTDNTNNEDGFAVFVTQGRESFQVIVPAGTTRYEVPTTRDILTCFAVVPFVWTDPVTSYPTWGWECTSRVRP